MTNNSNTNLTPALLLQAYAQGVFPMSDGAETVDYYWVRPKLRGIIPLNHFHISRSLMKKINKAPFDIRFDTDYDGVLDGCAKSRKGRRSTWINSTIRQAYGELFKLGYCHTVEAWENEKLVGGLYGIALGGAFFGESMFSYATDASKICLAHLVSHLRAHKFILLDTQFITDHLARLGAIEIPQEDYEVLLVNALKIDTSF